MAYVTDEEYMQSDKQAPLILRLLDRIDYLTDQILSMQREGYQPRKWEPNGAPAPDALPDAIAAAIASFPSPELQRTLTAHARARLALGAQESVVLQEILNGEEG
jgi:hypothetical protein